MPDEVYESVNDGSAAWTLEATARRGGDDPSGGLADLRGAPRIPQLAARLLADQVHSHPDHPQRFPDWIYADPPLVAATRVLSGLPWRPLAGRSHQEPAAGSQGPQPTPSLAQPAPAPQAPSWRPADALLAALLATAIGCADAWQFRRFGIVLDTGLILAGLGAAGVHVVWGGDGQDG